jgi:hypothetical protein
VIIASGLAIIATGVTVVVVLAGRERNAGPEALAAAEKSCNLANTGFRLGDEGRTLVIDGRGEEDIVGADLDAITCTLNALKVPEATQSRNVRDTCPRRAAARRLQGLRGVLGVPPRLGPGRSSSPPSRRAGGRLRATPVIIRRARPIASEK